MLRQQLRWPPSRQELYGLEGFYHHDVAALERRCQALLDVGHEDTPLIGPSRTIGATILLCRRAATNVIVFHPPCGSWPISRSPRGQRPLRRTILMLVAVSSINTSRVVSRKPCCRIQRRRARATSARCCSAARRLFLNVMP